MIVRRIPWRGDAAAAFARISAGSSAAVWLDSARAAYGMGRFSILGAGDPIRTGWDDLADRIEREAAPPVPGIPFAGGYAVVADYEGAVEAIRLDRFLVVDHAAGELAAVGPGAAEAAELLRDTQDAPPLPDPGEEPPSGPARASVTRARYLDDLAAVRGWLEAGDSYEACVTYRLRFPFAGDGFAAYRRLRRDNPAPYAAYVRLPGREILSCSPERFLAVSPDGRAETKPIKGTARRLADPGADAAAASAMARDPKTRAENLMIADLLRNDLGRISEPGSVEVPVLMGVETYATVHQLVTTVRSRLRPRPVRGVRAAQALFPPGSMTGAPKVRTVALLAGLEADPRGAYAGALGYVSRDGAVDLSVVIRTAEIAGGEARVGTGGAVTIDSDPAAELDETIAKSTPVLRAFGRTHPLAAG
ncbi:anthranilate synthase component I family protein [Microbacterium indicum]|uniref:anthranilate synthase component I family protein n=1 Tax=Microbacterium indicum TaxID=358100 RepID=UPI0004247FA6|nr:anthranilate synthase component I family protein [Microbacterium indicum]